MKRLLIVLILSLPALPQSGALINAGPTADIDTAVVPRLASANEWTGAQVFMGPVVFAAGFTSQSTGMQISPDFTGFANYGAASVTPVGSSFLASNNQTWAFYGRAGHSIESTFACGQSGPNQFAVACGVWLYDSVAKQIYTYSVFVNGTPVVSLQRFTWNGPGSTPAYDGTFPAVQYGTPCGITHLRLADGGAGQYKASYTLDGGQSWADYTFPGGASTFVGDYVFPQAYMAVMSQAVK